MREKKEEKYEAGAAQMQKRGTDKSRKNTTQKRKKKMMDRKRQGSKKIKGNIQVHKVR